MHLIKKHIAPVLGYKIAAAFFHAFFVLTVLCAPHVFAAIPPDVFIEGITLENNPARIAIRLSRITPYRVMQTGSREFLVAFRDAGLAEDFNRAGSGRPVIRKISFEPLPDNVSAIVVSTYQDIEKVDAVWINRNQTLLVRLEEKRRYSDKKTAFPDKKHLLKSKPSSPVAGREERPSPERKIEESPVADAVIKKSAEGNLDEIITEFKKSACAQAPEFESALKQISRQRWKAAFETLDGYVKNNSDGNCTDAAFYLRAFVFYKDLMSENAGKFSFLEASDFAQDAVSFYPDSTYLPYGMAILGRISQKLDNDVMARGYFKNVLEHHKNFAGTPEVLYELGRVYFDEGGFRQALPVLKEIINTYPETDFAVKANMEVGKVMYKRNNFYETIRLLGNVVKQNPEKVFESPDLLSYIGNANYHVGNSGKARDALVKVYNYFPESDEKDVVLSRIGDTYVDDEQIDKAMDIYRLVMDRYPGTDGYIISTMRLALHTDDKEEKEKLYRTVIDEFPDSKFYGLAMMRVAELQKNEGRFDESVETLYTLLKTDPRALRNDAVILLEESTAGLFGAFIKEENYPAVLDHYENNRKTFSEFINPNLFMMVGKSYLDAHLYFQARDLLMQAFEKFKKTDCPDGLYYDLGVALHECGDRDDALEKLKTYVKKQPKNEHASDAHRRIGDMLMEKKDFKFAAVQYRLSASEASEDPVKGRIILREAAAFESLGDYSAAARSLRESVKLLASAPENYLDDVYSAYKKLGEVYMATKSWEKAEKAFREALPFSKEGAGHSEVRYLLAETYRKQKLEKNARDIYTDLVEVGDPVWGPLAAERLKGMDLSELLEKKKI